MGKDSVAVIEPTGMVERVMIQGDLSKLTTEERIQYYKLVCDSVGLNPLTKPFAYIMLNGKLTLYALKDATDQLRSLNQVSVIIQAREVTEGIYVVTARATLPSGRTDESIGAVPIENLKGEARANAMMKAETKAKRRVTLSICGLGMLDESEIESIPTAKPPVERITEDIPLPGPAVQAAAKPADIVERKPQSSADAPKAGNSLLDDCIDLGRQRAIHRAFREAIRNEEARKHADKFLQDWLKHQGFHDAEGKGTTKTITMALYDEVLAAAVKYAESMPA